MTTHSPESIPVYTPPPPPVVYTPPTPEPTVLMSKCTLCGALLSNLWVQQHQDWHRANGLHGWNCDALRSLAARYNGDPAAPIDACSCGLEPKKKEN